MFQSNHWKKSWKKIDEFGPSFSLPTYYAMQNDLLNKCYAQVKKHIQRIILSNILLSRCTIVSNGWSNVQRKPLTNMILVSP